MSPLLFGTVLLAATEAHATIVDPTVRVVGDTATCDFVTIQDAIDGVAGDLTILVNGNYSQLGYTMQISVDAGRTITIRPATNHCQDVSTTPLATYGPSSATSPAIEVTGGATVGLRDIHVVGSAERSVDGGLAELDNGTLQLLGESALLGGKTDADGGCVYASNGSTLSLNADAKIQGCEAQRGGGVAAVGGSTVYLRGGITENHALVDGGGLHLTSQSALHVIDAGRVGGNLADGNGGGLLITSAAATFYEGTELSQNEAGGNGGGAYASIGSELVLEGAEVPGSVVVEHNTASNGGAVSVYRGLFHTRLAVLRDNVASGDGGGVHVLYPQDAWLRNTWLHQNTALSGDGGGIYLRDGALTMDTDPDTCPAPLGLDQYCSELRGNVAGDEGGGALVDARGQASIVSTGLIANEGTTGAGIGVRNQGRGRLQHSLVIDSVGVAGGAVEQSGVLDVDNCTLSANDEALRTVNAAGLTVDGSIVWGNSNLLGIVGTPSGDHNILQDLTSMAPSPTNLAVDPAFDATDTRSIYRVDTAISPATDSMPGGPAPFVDIDGAVRANPWDRGAFEQ